MTDALHRRVPTLVLGLALAAVSSGCVTPYAPPRAGATAKLVVRHAEPASIDYEFFTFEEAHACRGKQRMFSRETSGESYRASIRAGPLATFGYRVSSGSASCEIVVSFYPQPTRTYLFALRTTPDRCMLDLLDATDGDNLRREGSRVRRTFDGYQCRSLRDGAQSTAELSDGLAVGAAGVAREPPDRLDAFDALLDK